MKLINLDSLKRFYLKIKLLIDKKLDKPANTGNSGQVLSKTSSGTEWTDVGTLVPLIPDSTNLINKTLIKDNSIGPPKWVDIPAVVVGENSVIANTGSANPYVPNTNINNCWMEGSNSWIYSPEEAPVQDYIIDEPVPISDTVTASHVEGSGNYAYNSYCHAEGASNRAIAMYTHVEGSNNIARGTYDHIEGYGNKTKNNTRCSHVEGYQNTLSGQVSHAEGQENTISAWFSHVGGYQCEVTGDYSFVHGHSCKSKGHFSLVTGKYCEADKGNAIGYGLQSTYDDCLAVGCYNYPEKAEFLVGFGETADDRKNALCVTVDGKVFVNGLGNYLGKKGADSTTSSSKSIQQIITDLTSRIQELEQKVADLQATPATVTGETLNLR